MAIETIQRGVKVKNYKCFGDDPQGFSEIKPINIIIGKNNSGKSSLIDLVEYVFSVNRPMGDRNHLSEGTALVDVQLTVDEIERIIDQHAKEIKKPVDLVATRWKNNKTIKTYFESTISFQLKHGEPWVLHNCPEEAIVYQSKCREEVESFARKGNFYRIAAERDIQPEPWIEKPILRPNGAGATGLIRKHLQVEGFNQDLIYNDILQGLNRIMEPDSKFLYITLKLKDEGIDRSTGEICLKDESNTWIKLSQMGSGLKTVLLVLLNLHIVGKNNSQYKSVFGFEELENNLHPALQRKLFLYIFDHAKNNNCIFFITTHSPIVIDLFMKEQLAQIIHVQRNSRYATVRTINDSIGKRAVLRDLDFRASDLLMANGIIWVEGPSDVVYWELFFELYFKDTEQSIDRLGYTIQALSTAVWKHVGFDEVNWDSADRENLISLADLNHNHLVIIDADLDYEDLPPSQYELFKNGTGKNKAKLIHASMQFNNYAESSLKSNLGLAANGQFYFCINQNTVESDLGYFIDNSGSKFRKYFKKVPNTVIFEKKRGGKNGSIRKMELAHEISKFAKIEKLTLNDFAPTGSTLHKKIEGVFQTIKTWN